jgi:hypothetical protein
VANFAAPVDGCSTCATNNYSAAVQTPTSTTQTYTVDPNNGLSTGGGFSPTPADRAPTLDGIPNPQSSQRPSFNSFRPEAGRTLNASAPQSINDQLHQPAVINFDGHTARNPVRKSWDYTPVRFASVAAPTERRVTAFAGTALVKKPARKSRWVEID